MLHTIKERYACATAYWTCSLANCSSHFDETVYSYIAKCVVKVKSHMKPHFLNRKDQISVIEFLRTRTFWVMCETIKIRKAAAMWVLTHLLHGTLDNALNNRIYAVDERTSVAASMSNQESDFSRTVALVCQWGDLSPGKICYGSSDLWAWRLDLMLHTALQHEFETIC